MHLQVKTVLDAVFVDCSNCSAKNTWCIRLNLFTKTALAEAPPICFDCIRTSSGLEQVMELEEPDVQVDRRKGLRRQKKVSQQQEIDIAEELGARVQRNSGAMSGAKGDVRKKGVARVEAKFTTAKSYSLHLEDLEKIEGECADGEKPIFVIDYQGPTHKTKGRYAVLPFEDLKELLDASDKHR